MDVVAVCCNSLFGIFFEATEVFWISGVCSFLSETGISPWLGSGSWSCALPFLQSLQPHFEEHFWPAW
jgi:hypothetical protein